MTRERQRHRAAFPRFAGSVLLLAAAIVDPFAALAEQPIVSPTRSAAFAKDTCRSIASEAARRALSPHFFARLIWRESLFNPSAVSGKGARGIAQFMPGTALEYALADPLDPASAIVASARYLSDLRSRFGNAGLAAAAYNAGPNRVAAWREGRGRLPVETQNYVLWITGHAPEDWARDGADLALLPVADGMSFSAACEKLAARGLTARLPDKPLRPAVWQRMFAAGLGITQVKASGPNRIKVVIDVGRHGAR